MKQNNSKCLARGMIPALDGIRGFALLMVLLAHFFHFQITDDSIGMKLFNIVLGYTNLSIDVFFILSGLLITGILLDTKNTPHYYKNFFVRRFLRIFPLYYLLLIIIYSIYYLTPMSSDPTYAKVGEAAIWSWTYLFNFFIAAEGSWSVPFMGHFWSLAVEEQFYLFWPFIVMHLSGKNLERLCYGLILISALVQSYMKVEGYSVPTMHVFTLCRLGALAIGSLMAYYLRQPAIYERGPHYINRKALQLVLVSLAVKVCIVGAASRWPLISPALESLRTLSWLTIFAAVHLWALATPRHALYNRFLSSKPLVALGRYSYGSYLLHHFIAWPVFHYGLADEFAHQFPSPLLGSFVFAISATLISIMLGWLSYRFFESYFLNLKDLWAPHKRVENRKTPHASRPELASPCSGG
jgi:peptidoglycan/LPS O-acetylase OafA/YrhL